MNKTVPVLIISLVISFILVWRLANRSPIETLASNLWPGPDSTIGLAWTKTNPTGQVEIERRKNEFSVGLGCRCGRVEPWRPAMDTDKQ